MTSGHLGRRTATALTTLTALLATGLVAAPAYAADLVVTTTEDSGPGSLREALAAANASPADDRITFAVTGTIQLTSDQLEASIGDDSGDLVIEGPGADVLTVAASTSDRVLELRGVAGAPTPSVEVTGLTLKAGRASSSRADGSQDDQNGGALRAQDVALSLVGLRIEGTGLLYNPAARSGGGVSVATSEGGSASLEVTQSTITGTVAEVQGGGIFAAAGVPVTLRESVVRGNTASSSQGGMEVWIQYGEGGGVFADQVTLVDSTVAGNTAQLRGGGLDVRSLEMQGSTVSGNAAMHAGGGVRVRDADSAGQLDATSSTFSGNVARVGGAIAVVGADSPVDLTLTTVTANSAMGGGGVHTPGAVLLRGSVLGMNAGGDLDGGGSAVAERSLVQEPRDVEVTDTGSVLDADPVLAPLSEQGGPTATALPAPNSPLVDAGAAYGATTDQRGSLRPVDDPTTPDAVDGSDIGAVELAPGELAGQAQVVSLERPAVSGIARVGEVLRTDGGAWSSADVSLSYQWLRDGVPIEGATGRKYRVSRADRGVYKYGGDTRHVLSVQVTAQAPSLRSAVALSDTTSFVGRGEYFTMDGRPKVTGSTEVGSVLRAKPRVGAVTPRPESVTIQWIVGREYEGKENDRRFLLTRRMQGKPVEVVFTYSTGTVDKLIKRVYKPRLVH